MKKFTESEIFRQVQKMLLFLKPMKISVHSANTSFFLVLSVFPALLLLVGVLSYTTFGVEDVLDLLKQVMPVALLPIAEKLLNGAYDASSVSLLSVSAVTALWSASRGIFGLKQGLDDVYGVEERRGYFVTRGLCMVYTILFVVVLILTLLLNVFGRIISDYLHMTTNPFLLFVMDVIDFRFFLLLFLQTGLFTAMYAALPDRRLGLWESFPGAVVSSLGWLVFSQLFSLYVEHFPRYANIFGSVYAAALAMLWLYCCISIIFYGAVINRVILEKRLKDS